MTRCSRVAGPRVLFCWFSGPQSWSRGTVGGIRIQLSEVKFWIYGRRTTAKAFAKDVFINQERKLGVRRRSDTVVVPTINHAG